MISRTNSYSILLAVVSTAIMASPASANLLANPGFETPPVPAGPLEYAGAPGWNAFGNVYTSGTLFGPAGPHSGSQGLKLFGGCCSGVFQDFAASAGQTWDGGAWILNNSLDAMAGGQVAAVNIEWLDAATNQISFISNGTFTAASAQDLWSLQTISGVAPAGTAFARLVLITGDFLPGGPGGAPRYDDAFMDIRPVPVPAAVWLFGSGLGVLGALRRRRA
jgi:hypothetical protein